MPTWTSGTSIPAQDIADAASDKPLILSENIVGGATAITWSAGGGADANYPTKRVHDGYQHLGTRAVSAAVENFLVFQFDSSVEFDSISILDRFNTGGTGALVGSSITVDIATDSGFTTDVVNLVTRTVVADVDERRSLFLSLNTQKRISGTGYLRIGFDTGDATTLLMNVGEVIIGVRNQIRREVLTPGSKQKTASRVKTFTSNSGVQSRYIFNKGQQIREASFVTYGSDTDAPPTTEISKFTDWWEQISYGALPFIYCEDPSSDNAAIGYYMVTKDKVFPFMKHAAAEDFQKGKVSMTEMAPFYSQE